MNKTDKMGTLDFLDMLIRFVKIKFKTYKGVKKY